MDSNDWAGVAPIALSSARRAAGNIVFARVVHRSSARSSIRADDKMYDTKSSLDEVSGVNDFFVVANIKKESRSLQSLFAMLQRGPYPVKRP